MARDRLPRGATERQERADLHGHGNARKLVRPLTSRELEQLLWRNVPHPGDQRRRAGIEELRRALNGEVTHG